MPRVDNWDGETTVVDEDGFAIEVPILDGGTRLCPHENCRTQFREGEGIKLILHRANAHGVRHRVENVCKQCGDTFEVKKVKRGQMYCSVACTNEAKRVEESRFDIIDDIRPHLPDPDDTKRFSKDELGQLRAMLREGGDSTQTTANATGD